MTDVQIVELKKISINSPVIVCGFPDVGLVGALSTAHIIQHLDMDEVGYIDSDSLPPVIVLHKGEVKNPLRLYAKDKLIAILSEIPIPIELIRPIARSIIEWAKGKDASLIVSLAGIATPNRLEIDEPKVFVVSSNNVARDIAARLNLEPLDEGFIVGPYALILKEGLLKSLSNLILLAQCFQQYPDPGAAAAVLKIFSKALGLQINVDPLIQEAEEIRIKTRELMRRTQNIMRQMQKTTEYEVPLMYR